MWYCKIFRYRLLNITEEVCKMWCTTSCSSWLTWCQMLFTAIPRPSWRLFCTRQPRCNPCTRSWLGRSGCPMLIICSHAFSPAEVTLTLSSARNPVQIMMPGWTTQQVRRHGSHFAVTNTNRNDVIGFGSSSIRHRQWQPEQRAFPFNSSNMSVNYMAEGSVFGPLMRCKPDNKLVVRALRVPMPTISTSWVACSWFSTIS